MRSSFVPCRTFRFEDNLHKARLWVVLESPTYRVLLTEPHYSENCLKCRSQIEDSMAVFFKRNTAMNEIYRAPQPFKLPTIIGRRHPREWFPPSQEQASAHGRVGAT